MVDQWPSRLHQEPLPNNHDERQGIAALSPQFDLAVTSSRRSVAPIGTLSPQGRAFGAPDRSTIEALDPFQTHAVLTPTPKQQPVQQLVQPQLVQPQLQPSVQPPTSQPQSQTTSSALQQPQSAPSIAAADFLAEITHSAELQCAKAQHPFPITTEQSANRLDFDLFGIANLDLGPPVFEPQARSAKAKLLSPSALQQSQQNPHHSLPNLPIDHDLSLSSPPPPLSLQTPSHTITGLSASPVRTPRELAHPTRCVLLRNIPPGIDDDDIRQLLQVYGPLRDLGAQQRSRGGRGSVLATYYDLRHARAAVRSLDSSVHFGRRLEARFQCPADAQMASPTATAAINMGNSASSPSANQGTLVVFNLDTSTSAEDIRALFNTVGDVKEIRATPNKKHHKFVEFYDVRDAERAMHMLNKTEVAGKRIKIEISRPGGRSGNFSRHASAPPKIHANGNGVHHQQVRHQTNSAHVPYAQEGAYRNSAHQQSLDTFSQAHLPGQLLSSINHGVLTSQPFSQSPPSASFEGRQSGGPNLSDVVAPSGFDATNALAGTYERTFATQPNPDLDLGTSFQSYDSVPESRILHGSADPRGNDLHAIYSTHAGQVPKFPSSVGQHGITKPAPDSYIQALYNSPGSDDGRRVISPSLDKSPRRGQFHTTKTDILGIEGGNPSLYRGPFADAIGTGGNIHARIDHSGSTTQQRKIGGGPGSTIGDRAYGHAKQVTLKPSSHAAGGAGKPYSQQQSNSKYALDIRKVRSGEETRTALMIRNIPNKYNQKMLLSTLEEGHKGHFDFIYLPIDFKNKCNVGYAFINFTKPEYIEPFYDAFHGKKWGRFNSEKVCEITFARIQGRQQLIAHFQNSSLLLEDPKCRPVIFDSKGRQEEFPIGSHVRTRRGPSSRDTSHRACDTTPPYSPTKHRGNR